MRLSFGSTRTIWKTYRFEFAIVAFAIGLLATATVIQAARAESVKPTPVCEAELFKVAEETDGNVRELDCGSLRPWQSAKEESGQLLGLFTFVPLGAGAVLGSVLVAREVEDRNHHLAWSLGTSRRRWLSERLLVAGGLLTAMLIVLAVCADALEAAGSIGIDPLASMQEYGDRDIALVARGLGAFAIAVLLGALLRRQLPALIAGSALALLLMVVVNGGFPFGVEARVVGAAERASESRHVKDADLNLGPWERRISDGELFTIDQVNDMASGRGDQTEQSRWIKAHFEVVELRYRGEQFTEIQLREAGLIGILAVVLIGAAYVVVERIEPT